MIAQQPASIVGRQPTPYTYPDPLLLTVPYNSGNLVAYTYSYYGYTNQPAWNGSTGGTSPFSSWPSPFGGASYVGLFISQYPASPYGTNWVVTIGGISTSPGVFTYATFTVPGYSTVTVPRATMSSPGYGSTFNFIVPAPTRYTYINFTTGGFGQVKFY